MYCRMSDALQKARNLNKDMAKKVRKKYDIASAEEIMRTISATSGIEALVELTRRQDPELGDRLAELNRLWVKSKTVRSLSKLADLGLSTRASNLLKWMRVNGYYGGSLGEAVAALMEFEPVLHEKTVIAVGGDDFIKKYEHMPVKRVLWIQAIRMALVPFNSESLTDCKGPKKELSREFSVFYTSVVFHLIQLVKFEHDIAQPVKAHHKDNSEVYTQRIESLMSQLDSLREENDRLRNKERRELDSVVVPLEQELRKKDERIAELEEENAALREVQEQLSEQDEYQEELLELPTSGVTFIGGSPQLRSKVAQVYSEWKVVDTEARAQVTSTQGIVFLYSDYLSHTAQYMARKRSDAKPLYCHGRNWERLEHSMRTAYTISQKNQGTKVSKKH